jgi:hypothetical protein
MYLVKLQSAHINYSLLSKDINKEEEKEEVSRHTRY